MGAVECMTSTVMVMDKDGFHTIKIMVNIYTCFCSKHRNDIAERSMSQACSESCNSADVLKVWMKCSNSDFRYISKCVEWRNDISSELFSDFNDVISYDSIDINSRWWIPSEHNGCSISRHATHRQRRSTRNCQRNKLIQWYTRMIMQLTVLCSDEREGDRARNCFVCGEAPHCNSVCVELLQSGEGECGNWTNSVYQ